MKKYKGALFDLDGVLIDSEKEYTKIWQAIDDTFNSGYADLPQRIKGMTLDNIISTYFSKPGMKAEVESMLHKLENKMKYEWLPGARDFLIFLKESGIPTVLVTSSDNQKMDHLKEEIPELETFFNHIITGDKVSNSKPNPEGYLLAASLIGLPAEECVVFEDSMQGVKAGNASGAYVVGIEGTLPASKIQPYSDIVVTSLSDMRVRKLY